MAEISTGGFPFFGPQGKTTLASEMARWSKQVDGFKRNPEYTAVMNVPAILRETGIKSNELVLSHFALEHILKKHPEIDLALLKQLPRMLADPFFVYPYSDRNAPRGEKYALNVVTQMLDKN